MLLFGHVCSFASANMQNLVHHTDTEITVKDLFSNFTVSDEAFMVTTFMYSMKSVAEKSSGAHGEPGRKGRRSGEDSIVKHMDVYNKICKEVFERRRVCSREWKGDQENGQEMADGGDGDDSACDGMAGAGVTAQDRIKGWYQAAVDQLGKRDRGKKRKVRSSMTGKSAGGDDVTYDADQDYDWLEDVGEMDTC